MDSYADNLPRLPVETPDIGSPRVLVARTSGYTRFDRLHLQDLRGDRVGAAPASPLGRHPNDVAPASGQARDQTRVIDRATGERPAVVVASQFFAGRRRNLDGWLENVRTYGDADELTRRSVETPGVHAGPVDPEVAELGPIERQGAGPDCAAAAAAGEPTSASTASNFTNLMVPP